MQITSRSLSHDCSVPAAGIMISRPEIRAGSAALAHQAQSPAAIDKRSKAAAKANAQLQGLKRPPTWRAEGNFK